MIPRLKEQYYKTAVDNLSKKFQIKNKLMTPKILKVVLNKDKLDTSELMMKNVKPVDPEVSIDLFNQMIKKCKKRFVAVSVQLIVEGKPGTHANMLILDTERKTVELFEPHGKRSEQTGELIPVDVEAGDTVIYAKYGGTEITSGGEELLILSARDVLAVVK